MSHLNFYMSNPVTQQWPGTALLLHLPDKKSKREKLFKCVRPPPPQCQSNNLSPDSKFEVPQYCDLEIAWVWRLLAARTAEVVRINYHTYTPQLYSQKHVCSFACNTQDALTSFPRDSCKHLTFLKMSMWLLGQLVARNGCVDSTLILWAAPSCVQICWTGQLRYSMSS